MSKNQARKASIVVSLTNFLDSGCIVGTSCVLMVWALAFNITSSGVALLGALGANAFGAAVGALIGGILTDKFGRIIIYKYNLLIYALGIAFCMLAFNFTTVLIGIVISGLSVGAGVPASWSYISEVSGATDRAKNIGISQFAWSLGPAVIFTADLVLHLIFPPTTADQTLLPAGTYGPFSGLLGARLLMAILFVVALVAWSLQRQLNESKEWLNQDKSEEKKIGFGRMMLIALKNPVNVKSIIFLVAVYLTWNLAAGTNGQFMPALYIAAGNLNGTQQSILGIIQWVLISICSLAIFSKFGDKISHRLLFGVSAFLALLSWVIIAIFGLSLQPGGFFGLTQQDMGWALMAYTILWGVSAGFSAQCFYALWSTELFPVQYRGGVQGIMFFLVRGALGVWSLVGVGVIMGNLGQDPSRFFPAAAIMCAVLIISLLVGVIWCPNTRGKTLEEITKERYGNNI